MMTNMTINNNIRPFLNNQWSPLQRDLMTTGNFTWPIGGDQKSQCKEITPSIY